MRVTSVELHPADSASVAVLSFRDPSRANPFNIKNINGLDADEIVSNYYGVSANSSDKLYSLSLQKRTIVLLIELNPDFSVGETISDLRDTLYRMISSTRTGVVELKFKDGATTKVSVSGFVTKLEASHFVKTPELQVTIECSDPILRAPTDTVISAGSLNPVSTDLVDNLSTAPHGFRTNLNVQNVFPDFIIEDPSDQSWIFKVSPNGGFLPGDVIYFSSEHNNRYFYVARGEDDIHMSDAITPDSVWPIMFPGSNVFALTDNTLLIWNSVSYKPAYWGV